MARPEVTGKKQQQTDNSDSIPFAERVFTSKQTQEILAEGKTKFFEESLPKLDAYLDGNKLKITGRSIQALIASRLKGGRLPRPVPQLRKSKPHEPRAEA
jgi:hypothetical protein